MSRSNGVIRGERRETRVNGEINISIYKNTLSLLLSLYSPVPVHAPARVRVCVYAGGGVKR